MQTRVNSTGTTKVDFFWKSQKRNGFNDKEDSTYIPAELVEGVQDDVAGTLQGILEHAVKAGVINRGSHRTGVYQVQTSLGYFDRVDERQRTLINWERGVSAKLVKFTTWEEWGADLDA